MRWVLLILLPLACTSTFNCIEFEPNYERIYIREVKIDSASGDTVEVVRDSVVSHKSTCVEWRTRGR